MYDLVICFFYIQVEAIKKISEYVAQLRRVGKGHGNHLYISSNNFEVDQYWPSYFKYMDVDV